MAANFEQGSDVRPTGSKLDLIQATVAAISQHGLSELTSAKIAGAAGHTAASINFHFGSKEALLLATLREVSEEFARRHAARARRGGGGRPARAARHRRCEPRPGTLRFPQDRGLVRLPRRVQGARRLPAHLRRARCGLEPDGHRPLQAAHRRARQRQPGRTPRRSRRASWDSSTSSGRASCSRATTSTARPRAGSAAPTSAASFRGSRRASRRPAPARPTRDRSPTSATDPQLRVTLPALGLLAARSSTSSRRSTSSCRPGRSSATRASLPRPATT